MRTVIFGLVTMIMPVEVLPENEERPRILAVEIGDSAGLGGNVRLELDARRTVLVGRNGAGKSLLMEGLYRAAHNVSFRTPLGLAAPRYFRCDICSSAKQNIAYEYRVGSDAADEDLDVLTVERPLRWREGSWYERCWRIGGEAELWRVFESKISVKSGEAIPFSPHVGVFSAEDSPVELPPEAPLIERLLSGFRLVPAGVPRHEGRKEVLVRSTRRNGAGPRRWRAMRPDRVDALAQSVTSIWENRRETYDEFVELLRRLDLVHDIIVKIYEDPQTGTSPPGERQDYASVLFDGINVGLQSDGTLRVSEIILQLLRSGVSCLLIEEPETAVHPGLLAKLLALIESYSFDRQIIVSTHSPQVVNGFRPEQLRLVVRAEGVSMVHSLGNEDCARVRRYLDDDGTFADFLFSRASE